MTTAIDRAKAATVRAKAKQADSLRSYYWTIQRPGESAFWVHLNPPQAFEWVAEHYQGAAIVKGKPSSSL